MGARVSYPTLKRHRNFPFYRKSIALSAVYLMAHIHSCNQGLKVWKRASVTRGQWRRIRKRGKIREGDLGSHISRVLYDDRPFFLTRGVHSLIHSRTGKLGDDNSDGERSFVTLSYGRIPFPSQRRGGKMRGLWGWILTRAHLLRR